MKLLMCPRCKVQRIVEITRIGDRTGYFCTAYNHWVRWCTPQEMEQRFKTRVASIGVNKRVKI